MKAIVLNLFVLFIVLFAQCSKENTQHQPSVTLTLYDKPPTFIQSHIQGKWKFIYGKGGFNANALHYCDGCTVEFTTDGKIISNTFLSSNAAIDWQKERGTYTNGDSTYVMHFYDNSNAPWFYVIDGIFNDTLTFHDFSSDAIFYHFIRL